MTPKSPLQSKTIWVNILTIIAATTAFVAGNDVMAQYPQVVAALVAAQGLLNVVLRFVTYKPLT
jgi:hypothetical protein